MGAQIESDGAVEGIGRSKWSLEGLYRPAFADSHYFDEEQDPDPHLSEEVDPDPL